MLSFLKPWKYFSLKSLCAGTCVSLLTSASITEAKDGGRHSECAVFFIVISYLSVLIPGIPKKNEGHDSPSAPNFQNPANYSLQVPSPRTIPC